MASEKISSLMKDAGEIEEVDSQGQFMERLMAAKGCKPEEMTSIGPIFE